MSRKQDKELVPEFVFVCGAVGSGNTFTFNCLTQNENVYGIDEDAFGSTLARLLESERTTAKCPHSVDAFLEFLQALRRDRRTLLLKNPGNLRHANLLQKYLPRSGFVVMIREPRAAIASGIARHREGTSIEDISRRWLRDWQHIANLDSDCLTVAYEQLARDPLAVMQRIADRIMPLPDAVFTYARRMHRPERADPERWKTKVDPEVADQIEHWVETLELERHYQSVAAMAEWNGQAAPSEQAVAARSLLRRPLVRAKKEFFRVWYGVRRR